MRNKWAMFAAVLLAACNPIAQMNDADEQIDLFHERYSAGEFDAIYRDSAPEFREAVKQDEWANLLQTVSGRLGAVEDSSQTGVNVNASNGVTTTTITRDTTYEQGEGTETFIYSGSGDDMALMNWEVVSDQLIGATNDESKPSSAPADGDANDKSDKPVS